MFVEMLQGQKHIMIDKITVSGRSWAEMTVMLTFLSDRSVGKVVAHEKLPHVESIRNILSMFLVVKKHWDHCQVVNDSSQRSEAIPSLESNR